MKYIVCAKKWFDEVNGNTYHAVKTIVHDVENDIDKVILHGMTYGYGNQFLWTAYEDAKRFAGIEESYGGFARDASVSVQNVRRRDLTFDVESYIDIYGAENIYALGGLIRRSSEAFNQNLNDMYAASGLRERAIINTVDRIVNRNGILRLTSDRFGSCEYSIERKCFTN